MFDKNAINSDNIVSYIADIFSRRGAESYMGESVTMAQHMLQTAQEAENAGGDPELVDPVFGVKMDYLLGRGGPRVISDLDVDGRLLAHIWGNGDRNGGHIGKSWDLGYDQQQ